MPTELACPQCKSRNIYRTKRKGPLERMVLYPLGFRAYQCGYCKKRFYSNTNQAPKSLATDALRETKKDAGRRNDSVS